MSKPKDPDSNKLRNKGGRNPTYHSRQFIERLNDIYNENFNYNKTAERLNDEFGTTADGKTVKKLLLQYSSGPKKADEQEDKLFDVGTKKQQERWERAWRMIDDLLHMYDRAKEEAEENNISEMKKFVKLAPTILQLEKSMREQLNFIQKQQKEIIENQKNFYYTPTQINQYVQKAIEKEEDDKPKEIKLDKNE